VLLLLWPPMGRTEHSEHVDLGQGKRARLHHRERMDRRRASATTRGPSAFVLIDKLRDDRLIEPDETSALAPTEVSRTRSSEFLNFARPHSERKWLKQSKNSFHHRRPPCLLQSHDDRRYTEPPVSDRATSTTPVITI